MAVVTMSSPRAKSPQAKAFLQVMDLTQRPMTLKEIWEHPAFATVKKTQDAASHMAKTLQKRGCIVQIEGKWVLAKNALAPFTPKKTAPVPAQVKEEPAFEVKPAVSAEAKGVAVTINVEAGTLGIEMNGTQVTLKIV